MQIYHVFTKVHAPAQSDLYARVLAQVGIMLNGTTIDGVVFGGPAYNSQRIVRGDVIVEAASLPPSRPHSELIPTGHTITRVSHTAHHPCVHTIPVRRSPLLRYIIPSHSAPSRASRAFLRTAASHPDSRRRYSRNTVHSPHPAATQRRCTQPLPPTHSRPPQLHLTPTGARGRWTGCRRRPKTSSARW